MKCSFSLKNNIMKGRGGLCDGSSRKDVPGMEHFSLEDRERYNFLFLCFEDTERQRLKQLSGYTSFIVTSREGKKFSEAHFATSASHSRLKFVLHIFSLTFLSKLDRSVCVYVIPLHKTQRKCSSRVDRDS